MLPRHQPRLLDPGVRFVQLFDWGWDFHGTGKGGDIRGGLSAKMRVTDVPGRVVKGILA